MLKTDTKLIGLIAHLVEARDRKRYSTCIEILVEIEREAKRLEDGNIELIAGNAIEEYGRVAKNDLDQAVALLVSAIEKLEKLALRATNASTI